MTDSNDFNKRFDRLEKQLNAVSSSHPDSRFAVESCSNEVDLREIFLMLWAGKWWIILTTSIFAALGVVYALSLPDMYSSEGLYVPAQKENSLRGMAGQLGGLASIAGVNLGGSEANNVDRALALATSWPFLERIVDQKELAPLVLGLKGWDGKDLVWDSDIYDAQNGLWQEEYFGEGGAPTSYRVYSNLVKMVEASINPKTGIISISVTHYSPVVAEQWVNLIVSNLNSHFQQQDIVEARRNIEYIKAKISETSLAEMQAVFYGMIESELKRLMLAEVESEYLLKEIVPPKVAERRSKPARSIICILFVLIGGSVSCLSVVVYGVFSRKTKVERYA